MKKILMITRSELPQDKRVYNEAQSLIKKGYQVTILCISRNYFEKRKVYYKKIKIERIYLKKFSGWLLLIEYLSFTFYVAFKCFCYAILNKFDIIHLHNPPDFLILIGLTGKLLNKKIVFDFHEICPELFTDIFGKNRFFKKILQYYENLVFKFADRIITVNDSCKELFLSRNNYNKKIFVVRNGLDKEEQKIFSKRILNNKNELLFVGNISKQDNVETLLELAKYLNQKNLKFKINIIGKGKEFNQIKHKARKIKNINILGPIYNRKKLAFYFQKACAGLEPANLTILMNSYATFVKVVEYCSAGLPTICFDTIENRKTAGNSALYSKTKNDFLKNTEKIITNKILRRKLSKKTLEQKKLISWLKAEKTLLNVYKNL